VEWKKLKTNSNKALLWVMLLSLISGSLLSAPNNIFEGLTSIKDPFSRRDPFRAPKISAPDKSDVEGRISDGNYSNIPVLGEVSIDNIKVVGVIIGKERRAFVKISSNASGEGDEQPTVTSSTENITYTVKEGQIIGENDAELKAILPGGLILVEKTTNIYGQEEYLETVIPISK
jgi:type IV pilus assembly protein PilP